MFDEKPIKETVKHDTIAEYSDAYVRESIEMGNRLVEDVGFETATVEVEVENEIVDDDIKVKTSKSVDSEFMVMEVNGFMTDRNISKLRLRKNNGSLVHGQKGSHLLGMYVEGWEDEDKDLNVFDYDCEVYDLSTKALLGEKKFFVNKKQEGLDKIKRVKSSDVDAMSHECNLGCLEEKERKGVRRARNNAYELAKNSPKWGDKVGIELVILALADSDMEKGRPSSSLANKEGPANLIEVLFDVFDPGFDMGRSVTNPFEQILFGNEQQWLCDVKKFLKNSISWLCKFREEYVDVQSDVNRNDDGFVVGNHLVQECPGLDDKIIDCAIEIGKREELEDDREYNIREIWNILKGELGRGPYGNDYPKAEDSRGTLLFRIGNTLENYVYVVEINGELISSTTLVFDPGGVKVFGIWGCEEGMKDSDKCLGLSTLRKKFPDFGLKWKRDSLSFLSIVYLLPSLHLRSKRFYEALSHSDAGMLFEVPPDDQDCVRCMVLKHRACSQLMIIPLRLTNRVWASADTFRGVESPYAEPKAQAIGSNCAVSGGTTKNECVCCKGVLYMHPSKRARMFGNKANTKIGRRLIHI
nr:hypothetical protein [Tanacetum cinerariifolium]